jgi:hypothetical protein
MLPSWIADKIPACERGPWLARSASSEAEPAIGQACSPAGQNLSAPLDLVRLRRVPAFPVALKTQQLPFLTYPVLQVQEH